MVQSIADAEQSFGSARIELAPTIQPFHICLPLLLLLPILFLESYVYSYSSYSMSFPYSLS